jgi:hypothetical protein
MEIDTIKSLFGCPRKAWIEKTQPPSVYNKPPMFHIIELWFEDSFPTYAKVTYADTEPTPYDESVCKAWATQQEKVFMKLFCISTQKLKSYEYVLTPEEKEYWLEIIKQRTDYLNSFTQLPPIPEEYSPHLAPCTIYDGIFTFRCPYFKDCYKAEAELSVTHELPLTLQKIKALTENIREAEHTVRQSKQERDLLLQELFKDTNDVNGYIEAAGTKVVQIVKRYEHLNKEKIKRKLGNQYKNVVEIKEVRMYEVN